MKQRDSFELGETAELTRAFTQRDIERFAELTGDENPVHLDDAFARETFFGGRIAQGMLVSSLISSVLGNQLPGPGAIYRSQSLEFVAPVRPDERVTARVEVTAWDPKRGNMTLSTRVVSERGDVVVRGEARVKMESFLRSKT